MCNFAPQFQTGALVQLVRMPACHAGGRWFESCTHRCGERRRAKMCFGTIRSFFFLLPNFLLTLGWPNAAGAAQYFNNTQGYLQCIRCLLNGFIIQLVHIRIKRTLCAQVVVVRAQVGVLLFLMFFA